MAQQLATDEHGNLLIDVRGPRFSAAITMTLLATALVVQGDVGTGIVAWQVLAFAISTIFGLRYSPYGRIFRVVKRRLDWGAPPETEPEGPPRFAQLCGLIVGAGALVALLAGATTLGWVLVAVVLALSTLLALTGICVGCELYLLGARIRGAGA